MTCVVSNNPPFMTVPSDLDPFAPAETSEYMEPVRPSYTIPPTRNERFVTQPPTTEKQTEALASPTDETATETTTTPTASPVGNETSSREEVEGGVTHAAEDVSIVCEDGYSWVPERQLCLQTKAKCPRGMYLSSQKNKCVPNSSGSQKCQPGYEYRDDLDECQGEICAIIRGIQEVCMIAHVQVLTTA